MYPRKMKRTFTESLALGAAGERLVIRELSKHTEVRDYTNYDKNKYYQKKGFDLEFYNKNTDTWDRADVKTNILNGMTFAEMTNKGGNLGWIHTTKADFIICVDNKSKEIFYYSVTDMRNYISRKEKDKTLSIRVVSDNSYGTWVPVKNVSLIKPYAHLINFIGGSVSTPGMGVGNGN
jgi:hypothetical protein